MSAAEHGNLSGHQALFVQIEILVGKEAKHIFIIISNIKDMTRPPFLLLIQHFYDKHFK